MLCRDAQEYLPYALNGALFLDAVEPPAWDTLINTHTLDLGDAEYCILGQLHGTFASGCAALNLRVQPIVSYGLTIRASAPWSDFHALTEAWREVLRLRRGNTA